MLCHNFGEVNQVKKLLFVLIAALVAMPAFAGEDSTDRAYGYGPAWYETDCGLFGFNFYARSKSEAKKCIKPVVVQGNGNFVLLVPAAASKK